MGLGWGWKDSPFPESKAPKNFLILGEVTPRVDAMNDRVYFFSGNPEFVAAMAEAIPPKFAKWREDYVAWEIHWEYVEPAIAIFEAFHPGI